jgi:hypothetical protein
MATRLAAANRWYSAVIFDRADVDLVFVALHQLKRPTLASERPISTFTDLGARDSFPGRRVRSRPRPQRRQADNAK